MGWMDVMVVVQGVFGYGLAAVYSAVPGVLSSIPIWLAAPRHVRGAGQAERFHITQADSRKVRACNNSQEEDSYDAI